MLSLTIMKHCFQLEEINITGRDEYAVKGGFVRQLQFFSTSFGLKLCMIIFGPTEQPSHTLQSKDTTVQEAREAANVAENFLRRQRKTVPLMTSIKLWLLSLRISLKSLSYQDNTSFLVELMMEHLHIIHPHHQRCVDKSTSKPWLLYVKRLTGNLTRKI